MEQAQQDHARARPEAEETADRLGAHPNVLHQRERTRAAEAAELLELQIARIGTDLEAAEQAEREERPGGLCGGISACGVDARLTPSADLGGRCGAQRLKALVMSGISKRGACAPRSTNRFRRSSTDRIEVDWLYVWIDATYLKVREAGRITSVAVIIAVAVNTDGRRAVLGLTVGPSEAGPFWTALSRCHDRWIKISSIA